MAYSGWRRRRSFFAVDRELARYQVVAASASNLDLTTLAAGDSVGGVTLVTGDVVLALAQTDATQNGPHRVGGSTYMAHRPEWLCNMNQYLPGIQIQVRKGTYAGCTFELGANSNYSGGDGFGIVPDGTQHWWFNVGCMPARTVTGAVDISTWEGLVLGDATGGTFAVNLPDPAGFPASLAAGGRPGRMIAVVKTDSSGNAVTITCTAAAVYGNASLSAQHDAQLFISDGSAWRAVGTQ